MSFKRSFPEQAAQFAGTPYRWCRPRVLIPLGFLVGFGLFTLTVRAQGTQETQPVDPLAILASIARPVPTRAVKEKSSFLHSSEYSLQLTGLLSLSGKGAFTGKIAPESLGFLLGMRFHLNPWEALEVEVGSTSKGSGYFSPGTAVGATGVGISSQMERISLNEVITVSSATHVQPFMLAGGGAAEFRPSNGTPAPARSQVRGLGVLGAGLNFRFVHMGFRAEVEGLFYQPPDFHIGTGTKGWTHVAQPSAGLIFSF